MPTQNQERLLPTAHGAVQRGSARKSEFGPWPRLTRTRADGLRSRVAHQETNAKLPLRRDDAAQHHLMQESDPCERSPNADVMFQAIRSTDSAWRAPRVFLASHLDIPCDFDVRHIRVRAVLAAGRSCISSGCASTRFDSDNNVDTTPRIAEISAFDAELKLLRAATVISSSLGDGATGVADGAAVTLHANE